MKRFFNVAGNVRGRCVQLGAFILMAFLAVHAAAKPLVVASIKPVALITQELAGDTIDVVTLVPVVGSHHDYPLKPSDHQRLKQASLVIWVGPNLESFLDKPLSSMPAEKVMQLNRLVGIDWPASTEANEADPHFWLDINNLLVVAKAISEQLARLDSAHKAEILTRYTQMQTRLQKLDAKLTQELKPLSSKPFVVYHDGLAHWASHYQLTGYGYITLTPEQKPGAKHLVALRERYNHSGGCLFLEPNIDAQSAKALAQDLGLKLGILDIMGVSDVSRVDDLLDALGKSFMDCLSQK